MQNLFFPQIVRDSVLGPDELCKLTVLFLQQPQDSDRLHPGVSIYAYAYENKTDSTNLSISSASRRSGKVCRR